MQAQVIKSKNTITLVSASKKYLNCGAKGESASVHMEKKMFKLVMNIQICCSLGVCWYGEESVFK